MKEELSMILNDFAEVEYGMAAMVSVLDVLEKYYDFDSQRELKGNISVIKRQLESLLEEMSDTISKLDTYLVKK